jgi:hypothetical protein
MYGNRALQAGRTTDAQAFQALGGLAEKKSPGVSIRRAVVRRDGRAGFTGGVVRAPAANPKPEGDTAMRFMVIVKANKDSEAGVLPSAEILAAMQKYNEELLKAGVMLAGEGLHASSKGARVKFSGKERFVTDGPFAETKELIAGFWLWQCKSKEEAIEWLKRAPFDGGTEVEIRQVFEPEDFAPCDPTGELRAAEERLRAQTAAKK